MASDEARRIVAGVEPAEAIQRLIDGNARYVANEAIRTDHSAARVERAAGQQPFATIVCGSDSRGAPELVFDQEPGSFSSCGWPETLSTKTGLPALILARSSSL